MRLEIETLASVRVTLTDGDISTRIGSINNTSATDPLIKVVAVASTCNVVLPAIVFRSAGSTVKSLTVIESAFPIPVRFRRVVTSSSATVAVTIPVVEASIVTTSATATEVSVRVISAAPKPVTFAELIAETSANKPVTELTDPALIIPEVSPSKMFKLIADTEVSFKVTAGLVKLRIVVVAFSAVVTSASPPVNVVIAVASTSPAVNKSSAFRAVADTDVSDKVTSAAPRF